MTIFFVRTNHHYVPYDDWYKLAELSGFETCQQDEIDYDDASCTYIINHFGGRNLDANRPTKAQIILWQTEYIPPESYENDYGIDCRKNWRFWHMDAWQAEVTNSEYVPIGSHVGLGNPGLKGGYKYDVALLAYHSARRAGIFRDIEQKFTVAPNAWGDERERILYSSRLMVHVHQHDDMACIPGLRLALAAAHEIPVACEIPNHFGIYGDTLSYAHVDQIAGHVSVMLGNPDWLGRTGDGLHDLLCGQYTFKKVVEGKV